jgi:hypothetical protein
MAKKRKIMVEGCLRDVARALRDAEHDARHKAKADQMMHSLIFLRMALYHLEGTIRKANIRIVRMPSERFVRAAGTESSNEMKRVLAERRLMKAAMNKPPKPHLLN